ncbi:MAG: riboflavin synthase [Planctomycetota bacterium]
MFSGLVETKTNILALQAEGDGLAVSLQRPQSFDDIAIGDSIAINGCCLTITQFDLESMLFQAGEETLSKTTLGKQKVGDPVNCERSLSLGDRIGGHLVSGHIDGIGNLKSRRDHGEWSDMHFFSPPALIKQMASKGSVAVQGVSLTLVDVEETVFSVALIPHTLSETTLGDLQVGDEVNLETDLLAKYVEQQLRSRLS